MKKDINIVNRKSKFEYIYIRTEIAGIQLTGSEIKSIRNGSVSFIDPYCYFNGDEMFMKNVDIAGNGTQYSHTPLRERKLLLKKQELRKFKKELIEGLTIIPIRIFINKKGIAKVEIALSKGKKNYDKRETIKLRDLEREVVTIF
jgi:SsrA-binding protein